MRVFTDDGTHLLCNKLHELKEDRDAWRCIHLKLSALPPQQNPKLWSHFIMKGIRQKLERLEGCVYVCEDTDIFIVFEGRAQPVIAQLSDYFADISTLHTHRSNALYAMYDLGKEWLFLFFLLHRKRVEEEQWLHPRGPHSNSNLNFVPT
jgi:hypothetical protein